MNDNTSIELRLDAARDALARSRTAFLVSTVISVAILVSAYNAYLSWRRDFVFQGSWPGNEPTAFAQQKLISEWVTSHDISVSLIGVRFSVSDASVLGSLSLFIITIWFYYIMRRENHLIGRLLQDTQNHTFNVREAVLHGIASNLVFTTMSRTDDPIKNLDAPPRNVTEDFPSRGLLRLLLYLPVVTIGFVLLFDILTVFALSAPFRYPHNHLLDTLKGVPAAKAIIFDIVALFFGTLTFFRCRDIERYEEATATVLRQYARRLKRDKNKGDHTAEPQQKPDRLSDEPRDSVTHEPTD